MGITKGVTVVRDHGEMYDEDNSDAFVVNDQDDFHSYHTNGLAAGSLDHWTFDAGGAGTSFPIASIADGVDTGVDIEVTTTGSHGLAVGDIVSHTNLANAAYVGIFIVKAIISVTKYEVAAVYTATGTGTMEQAATLTCNAGADDLYNVQFHASATSAVNNEVFDYQLYKNAIAIPGSKVRRKFGIAADYGSFSSGAVISMGSGDVLSFALANKTGTGNLTIRNIGLLIARI